MLQRLDLTGDRDEVALERRKQVVVVGQEGEQSLCGQAFWSFGGLFLVFRLRCGQGILRRGDGPLSDAQDSGARPRSACRHQATSHLGHQRRRWLF
jgi:hypothetical protein